MKNYKKFIFSVLLFSFSSCSSVKETAEITAGSVMLVGTAVRYMVPAVFYSTADSIKEVSEERKKLAEIKPLEYTYYEGGQVKTRQTFKKPVFTTVKYRPDGIRLDETVIDINRKNYSERKEYWNNGLLKEKYSMWGEEKDIEASYYINGEPEEIGKIFYNPNGQTEDLKKNQRSREREGNIKFYFPDNILAAEENYLNGKKHGRFTLYTRKGILVSDTNYVNGKIHGKVYTYFPDGKICSVISYSNGVKNGKSIEYYYSREDNKKKIMNETEYYKGYKHGTEIIYHFNGKIYSKTEYNYNTIKKTEFFSYEGKPVEKLKNQ